MKAVPAFRLAYKLPLLVIGLVLTITAILITISSLALQRAAMDSVETQFHAMTNDRSSALMALIEGMNSDARTLASNPSTATALEWFTMTWGGIEGDPAKVLRTAYIDSNPNPAGQKHLLDRGIGDSPYHMHHQRFHAGLTAVMTNKGYYDVFLISPEGDVVYSVTKEADYAPTSSTEHMPILAWERHSRLQSKCSRVMSTLPICGPMPQAAEQRPHLSPRLFMIRATRSAVFSRCRFLSK